MANDAGACQTRNVGSYDDDEEEEKEIPPLDEGDIALLKTYGLGPYTTSIKKREEDIKSLQVCAQDIGKEGMPGGACREGVRNWLCLRGPGLVVVPRRTRVTPLTPLFHPPSPSTKRTR